jgi:hypothetical protein
METIEYNNMTDKELTIFANTYYKKAINADRWDDLKSYYMSMANVYLSVLVLRRLDKIGISITSNWEKLR